jgi:hypothetical protein
MTKINDLAFELSGVHATVQYGGHQIKEGAADRSIGFCERFNGALFFAAVDQDGDKVSFRCPFFRRHARSPHGDSIRLSCEADAKPGVNFLLRMTTDRAIRFTVNGAGRVRYGCVAEKPASVLNRAFSVLIDMPATCAHRDSLGSSGVK